MSMYGKKEKVCATCIYWRGKRTIEYSYIQTEKYEGKCKGEEGFYGLVTVQGAQCSSWRGFNIGR